MGQSHQNQRLVELERHSSSRPEEEQLMYRNFRLRNRSISGSGSDRDQPALPPQPMLLRRDSSHSDLEETVLNGESIPAFR